MREPGREQGKSRVPEKEVAINPINPRNELANARSAPGRKLSIACSIPARFGRHLAGSGAFHVPQKVILFSIYSILFSVTPYFGWANNILLM